MIILRLVLNVSPKKQKELKQALSCMISDIHLEAGCSQVNTYLDMEDELRMLVISHWENRERLNDYFRSEKFSALLGTRILLRSALSIYVDTVATREGMDAVLALRSSG
jgi:quinol monooxygenase YgiN